VVYKIILAFILGGWWSGSLGLAMATSVETLERMPVERIDLQAKLLREVLKFSSRPLPQMSVGIVYVPAEVALAQELADALTTLSSPELPIQVQMTTPDALAVLAASTNILYVTPGNAEFLDQLCEFAVAHQMFSATGVPEYVQQHKIALGFQAYQGKPQILLSLPVAQQVAHEFKNPKFLNLQTTRKLVLIK
jgi:hypothetical protein